MDKIEDDFKKHIDGNISALVSEIEDLDRQLESLNSKKSEYDTLSERKNYLARMPGGMEPNEREEYNNIVKRLEELSNEYTQNELDNIQSVRNAKQSEFDDLKKFENFKLRQNENSISSYPPSNADLLSNEELFIFYCLMQPWTEHKPV